MIDNHRIRIVLGVIFLSAALTRIALPELAYFEMEQLGLAYEFSYIIIIFELVASVALFFNVYPRVTTGLLIAFLGVALGIAFRVGVQPMEGFEFYRLFIFDPTLGDIALHLVYIVALAWLLQYTHFRSAPQRIAV